MSDFIVFGVDHIHYMILKIPFINYNMISKLVGLNRLQANLKNIYSAIVHTDDKINPWQSIKHTSVIGMGLQTPKFPLDFELYQHFRDTCNSVITTANILKLEANYLE